MGDMEPDMKAAPDYSLASDIDDPNLMIVRVDTGRFAGTIYSYGDMVGLEADGTPRFKVKVKQLVVNGVGALNLSMTDNVMFQNEVLTPILVEMLDLIKKAQQAKASE